MTSKIGLKHIHAIAPYVGGRPISEVAREYGLDVNKIVKLASNENPLGPSPRALVAAAAALSDVHRYPDAGGYILRQALSRHWDLPPDCFVLGNGSNELLTLVGLLVRGSLWCRPKLESFQQARKTVPLK